MTHRNHLIMLAAAACAVVLAVPARARLLGGPTDSCQYQCREDARTCRDAAKTVARMCADTNCSAELQAAQDACKDDPTSQACADARQAARECLQPCMETLRTSLARCGTELRTCLSLCPPRVPPGLGQKDPECVAGCRTDLQTCESGPLEEARICRAQCSDLVAAARQACRRGRPSTTDRRSLAACREARQAARECLAPCAATLHDALQECVEKARTCVDGCPDLAD